MSQFIVYLQICSTAQISRSDINLQLFQHLSFLQKLAMKILDKIKAFTSRIANKLLDFIVPERYQHKLKKVSQQQTFKNRKRRRTNKPRSCASNLSLHSAKSRSRLLRKQRKIRKIPFIGKLIYRDLSQSQDQLKSETVGLDNENIAAQEMVGAATGMQIQDENLFTDNNGLQISAIELRGRNQQLNNSDQSDPEILKFIFGDMPKCKENNSLCQQKNKYQEIVVRKPWWIQAIEAQQHSECSSIKGNAAVQQLSQSRNQSSSHSKGKGKTKKIAAFNRKLLSDKPKIKVIQIIDLVQDEEQPKLFQVPLAKFIEF